MIAERIRKGEGFFWVAIGIFICLLATQTGIGQVKEPGPGFIALAAGIFIASVGLVMILTAFLAAVRRGIPSARVVSSISWPRVLRTLVLLFGYAFLLDRLGHILTTFLVMWGLFYDWEKKNLLASFLLSVLITGVSYLFFERLLQVRFPGGIWP